MLQMRILAVDDDPVFLMVLQQILTSIGYEDLTFASSGSEAIELLRDPRRRFDCLLLDIEMPGMNGIELCRRVRTMPSHQNLPIVMITAMKSIEFVEPAFRAGANDYVHKPIDKLEMETRLRMMADLVEERRRRVSAESRLSTDFGLPVLNISFDEPFRITEAGSVIDWLALENYALTLGRLRLSSRSVIALRVTNAQAIYASTDAIGYVDTMANVASVIDGVLRSGNRLIAFAGQGEFVAMISHRPDLDPQMLQDEIEIEMQRYALMHQALEIPLPRVQVGEPKRAGLFVRTSVKQLFHEARQSARDHVSAR
ncbi:hypothetical protein MASR1M32_03940 [Rhodobacter sp.]